MYKYLPFSPGQPAPSEGGASTAISLPFSNEVDVCHQSTIPARPEQSRLDQADRTVKSGLLQMWICAAPTVISPMLYSEPVFSLEPHRSSSPRIGRRVSFALDQFQGRRSREKRRQKAAPYRTNASQHRTWPCKLEECAASYRQAT